MAQPIVCSACGMDVPPGRFACPSCGEVLASVSGSPRRDIARSRTMTAEDRPVPSVLHDVGTATAGATDAYGAVRWPDLSLDDGLDGPDADEPEPAPRSADPAPVAPAIEPAAPAIEPAAPAPGRPAHADPAAMAPAMPAPTVTPVAQPPGAYLPPVAIPAGAAAPARTWAGHGNGTALDAAADTAAAPPAAARRIADPTMAAEIVGWMGVAGPALILIGFLLPWSSISVIGADGVGYFDRWGFAGPGHLVVLLGVVAVFVMAVLRDRVPLWLGVGLPGLGVGALLIGLVWPYLVGPLGGSIGAMVVAIGAITLVVTGVAAVALDRHARGDGVV